MEIPRIIPILQISHRDVVKTKKFKRPTYIGDPINSVRIFNEKQVDELFILDITATKEAKNPDYKLIEELAGECFMPLAYGGGISTIAEAQQIFALGVEKICLQSAAINEPELVRRLADRFGSQSIVVSVDVKNHWLHGYRPYFASQDKTLALPLEDWLSKIVSAGAGEILLNSVERDGTLTGPDLTLIKAASNVTPIPITAVGGIAELQDFRSAIDSGASAVAAGSFFIFYGPHRAVLITYPSYEELKKIFE